MYKYPFAYESLARSTTRTNTSGGSAGDHADASTAKAPWREFMHVRDADGMLHVTRSQALEDDASGPESSSNAEGAHSFHTHYLRAEATCSRSSVLVGWSRPEISLNNW